MTKFKAINGWTKRKMIDHIKKNYKGKSVQGDLCMYRSVVEGELRACLAGMFIPNSKYKPSMERRDIHTIMQALPGIAKLMPLNRKGMLELQRIHDGYAEISVAPEAIHFIKTQVRN